MYVAGICLLFYLLFYLVAVYCSCMWLTFAYFSTCYFIWLQCRYCTCMHLLTNLIVILCYCSVCTTCMWLAFAYYSTCYFIMLECTVHVCGWHLLTILLVILFSCSVLYMYVAAHCLLFHLSFYVIAVYCTCMWLAFAYYSSCYFIWLQCTVHVRGWLLTTLLVILCYCSVLYMYVAGICFLFYMLFFFGFSVLYMYEAGACWVWLVWC